MTQPSNMLALSANPPSTGALTIAQNFATPEGIEKLGNWLATSGLIELSKKEQAYILAMASVSEGISIIDVLRKYDVIGNRLSQKSGSMLAEFRAKHGGDFWWTETGEDGKTATIVLQYRGRETSVSYTIAEAARAGLVNGKNPNWKTRPDAMLRSRATTKALRMVCPEIAAGILSRDEAEDLKRVPGRTLTDEEMTKPTTAEGLSFEEVGQLEALLEKFEPHASDDFLSRGWIKLGQTFRDFDPKRARKLLATPGPLLEHLGNVIAEKAALDAVKPAPDVIDAEVVPAAPEEDALDMSPSPAAVTEGGAK